MNGNYIDLIIILVLIYFATEAWRHGFWILLADFVSFLGSLILSLKFYKYISEFLKINFSLNLSIANALGFLFSAILVESFLGLFFGYLIYKLPKKIRNHKLNNILSILPGVGEGLILISFLLTLIIALPIKPQLKIDIENSRIGSIILQQTTLAEKYINEVFGGVINDSLTYFTIKPNTDESVKLNIASFNLVIDEKAETGLLSKVNEERKKLAIPELIWESSLVPVARNHAKDMWNRSYFSHYSPEGKDVGDRLNGAGIKYNFAGENLALAPTLGTAHTGLMNSKGHRENILEVRFKRIGIGVIDNGVYGKMFVQVFTD
ncbi:MAG: hypothetical protein UR39_C0004G0041 [Candidatus Woesebacteria bacterium GW2011_GWA1_33_30]|uniref:SCP domain-containing protein n=1 Tax=Candidatus Woesebacteria bacterium GW2011_GWA2_33_28 TaxID=1618561 RepID=A0A0F9ZT89_9BACT|nr:MAG: hypothetical protein UR38_C0004G0032 [Candidatus Woesebacteria bacterium GW2011_GWA2_33_28]KKP48420.1 MAG: hypothetical protein UR39_C0004G0041 [Candidatus Woesebacteria bacterium GW2011_GWA1_33_30]KKP49527.1 MAG: hypothetical protein UR40_C0005G0041 [Microgenomates group bacterium GW2011_GWC1_33_32]KKP52492.1 MAG: hypothetical protein UR44_C0002G0041 [Candidatus Woesebacteria bacterium GW2011_GWB1_33_38]KKP58350.1 MAG: hypothetical protein UR48_C0005G0028 [Microgenomates group bacteriu